MQTSFGNALADSDAATDLQGRRRSDSIKTAKFLYCSAVVDRNPSEGISGTDGVVLHRCLFSIFCSILFLILHLILEILLIVAVYIEVFLLQDEEPVTQVTCLDVDEPLRIKSLTVVAGLKMEMRAGRTA